MRSSSWPTGAGRQRPDAVGQAAPDGLVGIGSLAAHVLSAAAGTEHALHDQGVAVGGQLTTERGQNGGGHADGVIRLECDGIRDETDLGGDHAGGPVEDGGLRADHDAGHQVAQRLVEPGDLGWMDGGKVSHANRGSACLKNKVRAHRIGGEPLEEQPHARWIQGARQPEPAEFQGVRRTHHVAGSPSLSARSFSR